MSQYDIARQALNTAMNDSEGSAERELTKWSDLTDIQQADYTCLYVQKCA